LAALSLCIRRKYLAQNETVTQVNKTDVLSQADVLITSKIKTLSQGGLYPRARFIGFGLNGV
jgi:hypothetical protein